MTIATPATRSTADVAAWDEPEGLAPRGTLVVLGGRGETPTVYERFGARISRDAYRVRALGDATADTDAIRRAAVELLTDADLPAPKVLVGSDAGAALALEIAASAPASVDALVLAGLPTRADAAHAIEARTACPNHRRVLARETTDEGRDRTLPPELLGVTASAVPVPVLAIHGDADVLSPVDDAIAVHRQAPHAELHTVAGGRHDILNDVTHRSVAATIVLFLERVRASADAAPIVTRVEDRT
ncbi:alpha/beta hydrolase [Agromyces albus]|uniref:alpha/beta hydrolase n=1 Tax=Agromyces albus TaxID=205332 RepID=UPI00278AE1F3|nr:alpha/beta hydrolase [Agromyces albus]MDQ0574229.1 alpha-beta hydrolase superfamily lysophospholipase [Agromyces albus]